jgi:hypothetical protein
MMHSDVPSKVGCSGGLRWRWRAPTASVKVGVGEACRKLDGKMAGGEAQHGTGFSGGSKLVRWRRFPVPAMDTRPRGTSGGGARALAIGERGAWGKGGTSVDCHLLSGCGGTRWRGGGPARRAPGRGEGWGSGGLIAMEGGRGTGSTPRGSRGGAHMEGGSG